jgi:2-phospho-L-lactate/phosphoenolpyruvate guanylyltransferase
MQATVSAFDASAGTGRVLLDDGLEMSFDAAALDGSGLRLLRTGQRVMIETTGTGPAATIVRLQILTLR